MILFEHVITELLQQLDANAERLSKEVHRKKLRFDDIERDLSSIEEDFSILEKLLPPIRTDRIEAIHRHIGFVRKGMSDDIEKWIRGNADDIKKLDIPEIKEKVASFFREFGFLPADLGLEIAPLLASGEYDSAVRKAFLVLKKKAVEKYQMPENYDGEKMVHFLFDAETGKIRLHDDEKKRKAFRDFASGFFRFFRNEYMHNLGTDIQTSAQCILSVIIYVLRVLDK